MLEGIFWEIYTYNEFRLSLRHLKLTMLTPENYTRVLSDLTRLRILMLLLQGNELCVCQLTDALQMVQPKISRHLAVLRENNILQDRKKGLWVFYRFHSDFPAWAHKTLVSLSEGCTAPGPYQHDQQRLNNSKSFDETSGCL